MSTVVVLKRTHLCVLLDELCEVVEEGMLRAQEIELIRLLPVYQARQELTTIASHELSCQLDHVSVKQEQSMS